MDEIMEEMEEAPWSHSEALRVTQRHPGDIQEASRRRSEAPKSSQRHPGDTHRALGPSPCIS